jgi:hypothetical protein
MKKSFSILIVLLLYLSIWSLTTDRSPANAQNLSEENMIRFKDLQKFIVEFADHISLIGIKLQALNDDVTVSYDDLVNGKPLTFPLHRIKRQFLELKREVSLLDDNVKYSIEELKFLKSKIQENDFNTFKKLIYEYVEEIDFFNKFLSKIETIINKLEK